MALNKVDFDDKIMHAHYVILCNKLYIHYKVARVTQYEQY